MAEPSAAPQDTARGQGGEPVRPAAGAGLDLSTPPDFGALRLTD
ncbi:MULTISPECIES: hypothetical protein [Paracoccus]|nr:MULTISPECIES: hypothetical protein [Paracoccus]